MNMVAIAAQVCGIKPQFAQTSCDKHVLDHINALASVNCVDDISRREKLASIRMLASEAIDHHATHAAMPATPDLSGLIVHTYTTDEHLSLRCYLEHDDAIDGGGDAHPDSKERVWLVYAFAGAVDVFELVEKVPGLQAKIEAEVLASLKRKAKLDSDEAKIGAYLKWMEAA